jgi:hypothetical protein
MGGITGAAQKKAEKELESKSEGERLSRIMAGTASITSIRVLNLELQADGTVVLTVEIEVENDSATQKLHMKKIGNEWKLADGL